MARSKYEIKAQKELEAEGYLVDWKIKPSGLRMPRGYNVDYFGLFDLICYRKGSPLKWISVKGRAGVPSKHKETIKKFWLPDYNQKEIWSRSQSKKKYWNKQIVK